MIYLIGGPARDGKSTLAHRIRTEINPQVLLGDAIVEGMRAVTTAQTLPAIFEHVVDPIDESQPPERRVERLRQRDAAIWQFCESYLGIAVREESGGDILLEGGLWPDHIASFSLPHRAVFLVDTSADQAERLMAIRDATASNWMHNYSDERMVRWAQFNIVRSQRMIALCKQHHLQYYDIAEYGMEGAEEQAFGYLLEKAV